jgi:hypothetical protein
MLYAPFDDSILEHLKKRRQVGGKRSSLIEGILSPGHNPLLWSYFTILWLHCVLVKLAKFSADSRPSLQRFHISTFLLVSELELDPTFLVYTSYLPPPAPLPLHLPLVLPWALCAPRLSRLHAPCQPGARKHFLELLELTVLSYTISTASHSACYYAHLLLPRHLRAKELHQDQPDELHLISMSRFADGITYPLLRPKPPGHTHTRVMCQ